MIIKWLCMSSRDLPAIPEESAPVPAGTGVLLAKGLNKFESTHVDARSVKERAMQFTSSVKADSTRIIGNRCETLQRKETALVVRTNVKAGGWRLNRCEALHRKQPAMVVKTSAQAGGFRMIRCEKL